MRSRRLVASLPVVAGLLLAACGGATEEEHTIDEPASVEHLEGSDVARLTVTARAAERLDIRTAPVEARRERTVVPADSVLYDPNGGEWVYTSPEPLVFVRAPVSVDHFAGDVAVLSGGPPAGTQVVTVGVAELYGIEFEIGH
jgi:hypothetical protein